MLEIKKIQKKPKYLKDEHCHACYKPTPNCICKIVLEQEVENSPYVLILQHPQEPDQVLGTARLSNLILKNSHLEIGLSWPNLKKIVGSEVDPTKWAVVYITGKDRERLKPGKDRKITVLNRKGDPFIGQPVLEGIILLDGTWSQAKTLWWRNAWLTKFNRIVVHSKFPSLYGKLRKEPKREYLSTLESIAITLEELEKSGQSSPRLISTFKKMLENYTATKKAKPAGATPTSQSTN